MHSEPINRMSGEVLILVIFISYQRAGTGNKPITSTTIYLKTKILGREKSRRNFVKRTIFLGSFVN